MEMSFMQEEGPEISGQEQTTVAIHHHPSLDQFKRNSANTDLELQTGILTLTILSKWFCKATT